MNRLGQQTKWLRVLDRVGHEGRGVRRVRARRHRPGSLFEVLEDRQLLAATLTIVNGALSYDASNVASALTVMVVAGSNGANESFTDTDQAIHLDLKALQAGWRGSGSNTVTGPVASVASMTIGGTNAGQSLVIDYTNGDPIPTQGVTFNPAAATGQAKNSLALVSGAGGTTFSSETYTPTGVHAGTITYSDPAHSNVPIVFSNLTPVTDTVGSSSFFFIVAPPTNTGTTVKIVDGPTPGGTQTTEINDGGTAAFELIDLANKTVVTATEQNSGATTTINVTKPAPGLTQLFADSQALGGNETINVQATPSGVTTTTDTGSTANGQTNVGLSGLISSIKGPVIVQSTGGANTLTVDDSAEPAAATYTIASSKITASSLPSSIQLSGTGIATLNLESSGGSTVNLPNIVQAGVTTYNFTGGTGLGDNTLNTTSPVIRPDYATAGAITFGAGNPTINYTNFAAVNITKPAIPPTGSGVSISFTPGVALNNVIVGNFALDPADLSNISTDFNATINWGDSSQATSGTVTSTGGNNFSISGTHTYNTAGPFIINVTLIDNKTVGDAVVGATTVTVTSQSVPPPSILIASSASSRSSAALTAQGATVTGQEGSALNSTPPPPPPPPAVPAGDVLVATFTDNSAPGAPGDYTASIDWGDGTAASAGVITSQGTGAGTIFSVWGNHPSPYYADEGTYPVTVTITKTTPNYMAIASGQAVIGDAPLTAATAAAINASTGQPLPVTPPNTLPIIGSFTDANTGASFHDFNATIDWGDGSPTSIGTVVAGTTAGSFNVEAAHLFAKPGTYTPTIVVHDLGGSTVTLLPTTNTATITVTDAAVVGLGLSQKFTAVEGINTGQFVMMTYVDPNTLATAANESAALAGGGWGDGTPGSPTAPGSLIVQQIGVMPLGGPNPGAPIFEVLGSHTYNKEFPSTAPAALSVVITTLGGTTPTTLTSAAGTGVTVLDAALTSSNGSTITGIEGSATASPAGQTGSLLGSFTDANPSATTADFTTAPGSIVVDWGDVSPTTTPTITPLTTAGASDGMVFRINASHSYAEAGTYTYTVTVTDAGGSVTTFSGSAVIKDALLSPAATQPTVSTTEAAGFPVPQFGAPILSGAVASFTDDNTGAPLSDFTATIDWGDGTPMTAGTVKAGGAGAFIVNGSHTYADSGVAGSYPIQVFIQDVDGSRLIVSNTAQVADIPIALAGRLNPASDSGVSNTDAITNVRQPDFFGTSEPYSHVSLFATAAGGAAVSIGQAQAGGDGSWNIVSSVPLADGSYTITATAVDQFGVTRTTAPATITPKLVIDTVGPKVTSVTFNRFQGQIVVTFQDYGGLNNAGSGLNGSSVVDAHNYQLVTVHHPRVGKYRVNTISNVPGTTSGTQTATLTINKGHSIKGGWYFFTIDSASSTNPSGVRDIAGNALDGEFFGYFPSGNNVNGGNFVAQLTARHHTIFAPSTVVGRATPVSPPGTRQGKVTVPGTFNPSKVHHSSESARAAAKQKAPAKLVHHSSPALSHLIDQVGSPLGAATKTASSSTQPTAMGALGTLDQALNQLGGGKNKKS